MIFVYTNNVNSPMHTIQRGRGFGTNMAWRTLGNWLSHLEKNNELIRIKEPVEVTYEAGAIADLLVKNEGPAVIFEKPILQDGSISKIPLAMNIFGTHDRTMRALEVTKETEIGDRMVAMMKPDIGTYMKKPWKGIPVARDALAFNPRKVKRAPCQQVVMDNPDLTKLPIPKTWPNDGGPFVTLPLVVTKDPESGDHNLGMYRSQIFGPKEAGLHWQIHKHAADHAAKGQKIPVAICMGGPPELIFSAISPLPDNLSEYQFAGILGRKRLKITKAKTQDLWVPAEADIVIEGWCDPTETRTEGPFGDHFGFYSLTGQYPVLNVTAITMRKNAVLPATIVGLPPMEDGYLGEAIGRQFSPVLNFQHRDVLSVHLPLETGFHNLAILASKQRYPRQARKTALGLFGAGQMMFLKIIVACDPDHDVKDLDAFLDVLNDNVEPKKDMIILEGMVADSLEVASPYENVHDKLLIDATTIPKPDPRSDTDPVTGSFKEETPYWRRGGEKSPAISDELLGQISDIPELDDLRQLRGNMLVVTTKIEGTPSPETGLEPDGTDPSLDEKEKARINRILQLKKSIFQLDSNKSVRWLFITNSDLNLHCDKARRRLLWQLTSRFDVGRGLSFDEERERICWDATTPIPSTEHTVRRWPAVTLHSKETLDSLQNFEELNDLEWPEHLEFK